MDKSYVKSIFGELWDPYQLMIMNTGGNLMFWNFLKEYQHESKPIAFKYGTDAALYHKRKLASLAVGKEFIEKQPPRNFDEYVDRTKETAGVYA